MAKPVLKPLPDKKDPQFNNVMLDNVIEAYRVFQSDTMALDYCGVKGKKQRLVIIGHEDYKVRTRKIRAEKYLEELEEIERLSKDLGYMELNEEDYDIRGGEGSEAKKAQFTKEYKDLFAMRLKAAELRRELLNLSAGQDNDDAAAVLNVVFIPVTREEWEKAITTEVFAGREDGEFEDGEEIAGIAVNGLPKKLMEEIAATQADEISGGYITNKDGSVEDIA